MLLLGDADRVQSGTVDAEPLPSAINRGGTIVFYHQGI